MQKLKLGVIGCGAMGSRHIQAAATSDIIDLVAIADPVAQRTASLAREHAIPRTYDDGMKLIADGEVQAVALALPTSLRSGLALAAAKAGKHLLVEKPAAMDADDLTAILAAMAPGRVGACCSSRYRFLPSSEAMTAFLADRPLGDIRSMSIRHFTPVKPWTDKPKPAWRLSRTLNGGGILVNWGCYDFDYMLGITGWSLKPVSVTARSWQVDPALGHHVHPDSDAETHVAAFIQCQDGCVINYERGEFASILAKSHWDIVGNRGSLRLQMINSPDKAIHHDSIDPQAGTQSRILWQGQENGGMIHARPVLDFASAIVQGHAPATSLEQSMTLQRIIDAIYQSARTGRQVMIESA